MRPAAALLLCLAAQTARRTHGQTWCAPGKYSDSGLDVPSPCKECPAGQALASVKVAVTNMPSAQSTRGGIYYHKPANVTNGRPAFYQPTTKQWLYWKPAFKQWMMGSVLDGNAAGVRGSGGDTTASPTLVTPKSWEYWSGTAWKTETTLTVAVDASCDACAPGTYSSQVAQGACAELCPAGTFADQPGQRTASKDCRDCTTGQFNTQAGQTGCALCPAGKFSESAGARASCKVCGAGLYGPGVTVSVVLSGPSRAQQSIREGSYVHIATSTTNGRPAYYQAANKQWLYWQPSGKQWLISGDLGSNTRGMHVDGDVPTPDLATQTWEYYSGSTKTFLKDPNVKLTAASTCVPCGAGKFNDRVGQGSATDCKGCAKGTYLDQAGQAQCANCTKDTYNDQLGQTTASACKNCDAGKFTDAPGQETCKDAPPACGAGRYSDKGTCRDCTPGQYSDKPGQTACTLCAPGKYLNETGGAVSSTTWALGTWPLVGKGSCDDVCGALGRSCDAGALGLLAGDDDAVMLAYTAAGRDCTKGLSKGCASSGNCAKWGAPYVHRSHVGDGSCWSGDPPAQCSTAPSDTNHLRLCPCKKARRRLAATKCKDCAAGKYGSKQGLASCTDCAKGTYGDLAGQDAQADCKPCANGTYGDLAGQAAPTDCKPCAMGTYGDLVGQDTQADCKDCPAGTYNDQVAQTAVGTGTGNGCKNCTVGLYNDQTGQDVASDCKACGKGKYNDQTAQDAEADCKDCVIGKFQDQTGQDAAADCRNCAKGLYSDQAGQGAAADCKYCAKGTYNDVTGQDAQADCKDCDKGTYGDQLGQDAQGDCKGCARGKYNSLVGQVSCKNCDAGLYGDKGFASSETVCKACPRGTASAAPGQEECKSCMPGKIAIVAGLTACAVEVASHDVTFQSSVAGFANVSFFDAVAQRSYQKAMARTIAVAADDVLLSNIRLVKDARRRLGVFTRRLTASKITFDGRVRALDVYDATKIEASLESVKASPAALQQNVRKAFADDKVANFDSVEFDKLADAVSLSGTPALAVALPPPVCAKADDLVKQQKVCPKGLFHDQVTNASRIGVCTACKPGTYTDEPGQKECKGTMCAKGKFYADAQTQAVSCISCKPGKYTEEEGLTACKGNVCIPGKFGSEGQTANAPCQDCEAGQYSNAAGQTACKGTMCQPGEYGRESAKTQQGGGCRKCAPGQWTATPGLYKCKGAVCAAGKFSERGATSASLATCKACPSGKTTASGQDVCTVKAAIPCIEGQTKSETGFEPCYPVCAAGTYSSAGYGTSGAPCRPCKPGSFAAQKGSTACTTCPGGQTQIKSGRTSCDKCPGEICFTDSLGTKDSKVQVKVLAQTETLNLFGWDALTNYKGHANDDPIYYELHAAKVVDPVMYKSRKWPDLAKLGLNWTKLEFGPSSVFKPKDTLRLVQTSDAAYNTPRSTLEKHFIKGSNALFFFKFRASMDPPSTRVRFSDVLEGVIEDPEAPTFEPGLKPQTYVASPTRLLPFKGESGVTFSAAFRGKPLPDCHQVTWKKDGVDMKWPGLCDNVRPGKLCDDGSGRTFTCPTFTMACTEKTCTSTLNIAAMERNHTGKYKIHLENFVGETTSPDVELRIECQDCASCDQGAGEEYGECICNEGRYQEAATRNETFFTGLLGFQCDTCHEGWDCGRDTNNTLQGRDTRPTVPVKEGWWRRKPTDKTSIFCEQYATETASACVGGRLAEQCAPNHIGIMCSSCIDGYAIEPSSGECEVCPSTSINVDGLVVGLGVMVYIAFVAGIYCWIVGGFEGCKERALRTSKRIAENKHVAAATNVSDRASSAKGTFDEVSAYLDEVGAGDSFAGQQFKILISWLQNLAAFVFTFSIPWPKGFRNILTGTFTWVNIDFVGLMTDFKAIKCNLDTNFKNNFAAHMALLPMLVVGVVIAVLIARWRLPTTDDHRNHCKQHGIKALGFLVFLIYPGLCSKIFTVFKCVQVDDDGAEFMVADLEIECNVDGSGHNDLKAVAFVFMIIYALGIPFATWLTLWSHRQEIERRDEGFGEALGQLYLGYTKNIWFWEVVELLRKLVLTGALILLAEEGPTQIAVGCTVCALYLVYFLWTQPLGLAMDHVLQIISSVQLLLTLIMGLYLKGMEGVSGSSPTEDKLSEDLLTALFALTAACGGITLLLSTQSDRLEKMPLFAWLYRAFPQRVDPHKEARKKRMASVTQMDNLEDALNELAIGDSSPRGTPTKNEKVAEDKDEESESENANANANANDEAVLGGDTSSSGADEASEEHKEVHRRSSARVQEWEEAQQKKRDSMVKASPNVTADV
eukprot:g252.t1